MRVRNLLRSSGKHGNSYSSTTPKLPIKQSSAFSNTTQTGGLDVRIIGRVSPTGTSLKVAPLTSMRLHTRTIIRDGREAFTGSQSLRRPELDLRREIGIVVQRDEGRERPAGDVPGGTGRRPALTRHRMQSSGRPASPSPDKGGDAKAKRALGQAMPPLRKTSQESHPESAQRHRIRMLCQNVELKETVKAAVKIAAKEAVMEIVDEKRAPDRQTRSDACAQTIGTHIQRAKSGWFVIDTACGRWRVSGGRCSRNQNAAGFRRFSGRRVEQYLKLHQDIPRLRTTTQRQEIADCRSALAQKIREARAARQAR